MKNFKLWAALLLAGILTACGGGGGGCDDALTGNCNATGGGGTSEIATLQVITSSPLLQWLGGGSERGHHQRVRYR